VRKETQPLLSMDLDGTKICDIHRVPIEERLDVRLESQHPILRFTDSDGRQHAHDLTTVKDEGCSWIHLSVRVHDSYACQADCLINNSKTIDDAAFQKGEIKGIRFQPIYLPECTEDPSELIGQGLLFRGLHFSGRITPGNVSASCLCDFCHNSFRLQSTHVGFGDNAYFYCDKGLHTLITSSFIKGAPAPLSHPDPKDLASLEERLPNCRQCGGTFKYSNPLLCPHCNKPYIDFEKHPDIRDNEYYGNCLYGTEFQKWDETD